jgi:hypothetical protein
MQFTQAQITTILKEILQQEDGLNTLMELTMEALMRAARSEHNVNTGD